MHLLFQLIWTYTDDLRGQLGDSLMINTIVSARYETHQILLS